MKQFAQIVLACLCLSAALGCEVGADEGGPGPDAGGDADVSGDGGGLSGPCVNGSPVTDVDPSSGEEMRLCACDRGFAGDACDECATGYGGERCDECADGFFGSATDSSICNADPCVNNPCLAGGTCELAPGPTGFDVAVCTCYPNRSGEACDTCAEGYEGVDCELCANGYVRDDAGSCVIQVCAGVDCGEHGTCADRDGSPVCLCDEGWTGEACDACAPGYQLDYNQCVLDACLGVECGHGECTAVTGVPLCLCETGYAGESCDVCADGYVMSGRPASCQNVLPVADERLVSQFDAAAPGTFLIEDARVRRWYGSQGDGLLWAETANQRPDYHLLPPSVSFNGSGQYLRSPQKLIKTGDNYSVFVVASWASNGARQAILDSYYTLADAEEAYSLEATSATTVRFRHRGVNDAQSDSVELNGFDAAKGRQLVIMRRVPLGGGHVLSLSNGTKTTTAPTSTSNFGDDNIQVMVGRCLELNTTEYCYLKGNVNEVLVFEGAMNTQELESVTDYLRVKWGL